MYQLILVDNEDKLFVVGGDNIDQLRVADFYIRGRPEVKGVFKGSWIYDTETEEVIMTFGKKLEGKHPKDFGYIRGQNPNIRITVSDSSSGGEGEGLV